MIATVTNQGKIRRMIVDEVFNSNKLIEFLGALTKDAGCKVFLILDNLWVHTWTPTFAKLSIDDFKKVKIAAIHPDFM